MPQRFRSTPRRARTASPNPEWTAKTFARARPAREVLPELLPAETAARLLRPRGRPKSGSPRTPISLRLPPETLAAWKASGPGWQTRMADLLTRRRPGTTR